MGCASSTPSPAEKPTEASSDEVQESSAPGRSIKRRLSQVQQERQTVLGENKFLSRADTLITGVLPLANAFDHFDSDKTSSLSVEELQDALSHLGIESNSETARRILKQYDSYNDGVIDVKEFATIVRDIKLMIAFDANGDGVIDADELLPLLKSLGVNVDMDGVQQIMQRFDVDRNGSIDLVELSSIVRTAQAFVRYDSDGSGAIEIDELRDALRKLGLKAGALEAQALFSRYDTDGNQALELHEFAVLVRDLQLYSSFDTDCNGVIDADEICGAMRQLGLESHPAAQSEEAAKPLLEAWDLDGDGGLNISEFTRWASDVRAFRDADLPSGDHVLTEPEFLAALKSLGVEPSDPSQCFARYADQGGGQSGGWGASPSAKSAVSLLGWAAATRELVDANSNFEEQGIVMPVEGSMTMGRSKKMNDGAAVETAISQHV